MYKILLISNNKVKNLYNREFFVLIDGTICIYVFTRRINIKNIQIIPKNMKNTS